MRAKLGQPRRVRDLSAAGDIASMLGVDEHDRKPVFHHEVERFPIVAGRLHHHRRHPLVEQVVDQRKNPPWSPRTSSPRRERPHRLPGTLTATFASRLETSIPAARSCTTSIAPLLPARLRLRADRWKDRETLESNTRARRTIHGSRGVLRVKLIYGLTRTIVRRRLPLSTCQPRRAPAQPQEPATGELSTTTARAPPAQQLI